MFGVQRYSTCSVYEPSLLANHFSSRRKFTPELAKRTPRTAMAAALAAKRICALSAMGIVKGSVLIGDFQDPVCAGPYGASTMGRSSVTRLARACSTAWRAVDATAS